MVLAGTCILGVLSGYLFGRRRKMLFVLSGVCVIGLLGQPLLLLIQADMAPFSIVPIILLVATVSSLWIGAFARSYWLRKSRH